MLAPNSQYIEDALKHGINRDAIRFFRKRFANASEEHVSSVVATLTREEMIALKARVDEIVRGYNELVKGSVMSKEQRDLSKVMYIYNYLLENVMYTQCQFAGNSSNVFGGNPRKNSIYGALVMHDAVCSGISEAFDCLCKVLDVESTKVLSTPSDTYGGHAFNTVKIGNTWYRVDAALEIGLCPGRKIKDGKWKDRVFLVPFSEPHRLACVPSVADCTATYPRSEIANMKRRLEDRGLKFEYERPTQIIHEDMRSALNSFLIKRVGNVDVEMAENFENSIAGTFNITKRNGVYVTERRAPVIYVEDANTLSVFADDGGVELYENGDSRFVIKSIRDNQISGFTILRRNGVTETRLPIARWNPINNNSLQPEVAFKINRRR